MTCKKHKYVIAVFISSFITLTVEDSPECVIDDYPKTRTFSSIDEYQKSRISFNPHHHGYEGNVVAFNYDKLKKIPKNTFFSFGSENIVELHLEHKQIEEMEPGAFLGLTCLNELSLSYNNLTDIEEGTFENLNNLKNLFLNYNFLKSTPDSGMAFLHLKNLKILDMSHNQIEVVHRISFDSLSNLQRLNLGYNKIRVIEDTVFNTLVNLQILLLNNNYITTIAPHRWENLQKLTELNLADNFLSSFDAGYNFSFANLKTLNLSGNSLTVLEGINFKRSLKMLERLDIGNNPWLCKDLNDFKSKIYGSKIHVPADIKCSTKKPVNWSIPTPPPVDQISTKDSNITLGLLNSLENNITKDFHAELVEGNKDVLNKLEYIQNILTFLNVLAVLCFLFVLMVKLQVCGVLSHIFEGRQSDYTETINYSPHGPEMYRLIGR